MSSARLKRIEQFFLVLFRAVLGIGILFLAILIALVLGKSLHEEQYVLQPFHVPEYLEKNGLTGEVLAMKIQDEVNLLKESISSAKSDSVQFASGGKPEMDMAVMGLGLSLNALTYYCRELFGRENRQITGEVVDLGSRLSLTIRMTGYPPKETFIAIENDDRFEALETLTKTGGKIILGITDPYRLAVCEYHEKNFDKALAIVREIIAEHDNPDHKWAFLAWGNILREQGHLIEAEQKYQESLKRDPDFPIALQALGWTKFQQKAYGAAAEVFEHLVAVDPDEAYHLNSLAQSKRQSLDYEGASEAFERFIEAKPELHWPSLNYASMLMHQMHDTIQAMKWYRQAQKLANPGVEYFFTAAILYSHEDKLDSALWAMERILDYDPQNITAIARIASYKFNHEKDYEAVIARCDDAMAIVGDEKIPYGDRLYQMQQLYNYTAMAHYMLHAYDASIALAKKAIALDPEVSYPYTTLAEAYLYKGQKELFYQEIEHALELGFDIRQFLEEEPYLRVANEQRLRKLIDTYFVEILD